MYMHFNKIPSGYKIPVLVYHCVNDIIRGEPQYTIKPADMETHISLLLKSGYTLITFEDLPNIDKIEKPIILTFDDGYADNYDNLFPLLKKYNVRVTISVIYGMLGTDGKMTAAQLREMSDSGLVSIQSHCMSHVPLDSLNESQLEYEIVESKRQITGIIQKEPFLICYPFGIYSSSVIKLAEKYYLLGLSTDNKCWVTGGNNYAIGRHYVDNDLTGQDFLDNVSWFIHN